MKSLLLKTGVPAKNIRVLTAAGPPGADKPVEAEDRWPTRNNIKRELDYIKENAEKGDLVYFHYSGHGILRNKILPYIDADEEDDGPDGDLVGTALVMTDVQKGGAYLTGRQLGVWVQRMVKLSGLRMTVVLDSCYSGDGLRDTDDDDLVARTPGHIDDSMLQTDLAAEQEADIEDLDPHSGSVRDAGMVRGSWLSNPKGCTVVTACSRRQKASERLLGGNRQGVLTFWLIDLLQRYIGQSHLPSHSRAVDHVRRMARGAKQTPMVYGDGLFEFFGATSYDEGMSCNATHITGGYISIDIGDAQGVVPGALYDVTPALGVAVGSALQVEVKTIERFRSSAQLVGKDAVPAWPEGETRIATLRQWALPGQVLVYLDAGAVVYRDQLSEEFRKTPGLQLGDGQWTERDLVVRLDDEGGYEIFQNNRPLPRLLRIPVSDTATLAQVLGHIARFKALLVKYYRSASSQKLRRDNFTLTPSPETVIDGEDVELTLTYTGSASSLWVSVYNFTASWGIQKIDPDSGTAATHFSSCDGNTYAIEVPMTIPRKSRDSDPDGIEDHFFFFVSTVPPGQAVPSWGDICLPSLRTDESIGGREWTEEDSELGINDTEDEDRDGGRAKRKPAKASVEWIAIPTMVRTIPRNDM